MRRTKVGAVLIAGVAAVALAVTGTAWASSSGVEATSSQVKDEPDLNVDVELLPPTVTDDGESVPWQPVVHNNSDQTVETKLTLAVENIDNFGNNAVQFEDNLPGPEPDSTAAEEDIWCQMGADDLSYSFVYCWMTLPPGEYSPEGLRLHVMHPDKADFSESPAIDVRGKLVDVGTDPSEDLDHESRKLPLEHVE